MFANGVVAGFDGAYDGAAHGEDGANCSHTVISALSLDNLRSRAGERPFQVVYVVVWSYRARSQTTEPGRFRRQCVARRRNVRPVPPRPPLGERKLARVLRGLQTGRGQPGRAPRPGITRACPRGRGGDGRRQWQRGWCRGGDIDSAPEGPRASGARPGGRARARARPPKPNQRSHRGPPAEWTVRPCLFGAAPPGSFPT